jgi:hypothetical protein
MIYAWEHPESIHRSVMIGANPPGNFLWDARKTDEQIARYAEHCSQDESCSGRTDDLAASLERAEIPDRWFFLPIEDASVRVASFYGLAETTSEAAPISGPMTLDAWLAAEDGDASAFWLQSLLAELVFPESFVWGQLAAAARLDAQLAADSFASGTREPASNLGDAATAFIWGGGRLADAWPVQPGEKDYDAVRPSDVDTLLIGGELDFAAPPQSATEELLPSLTNGKQVVLPGFGHSASFWTQQPEAGTYLIAAYLATGKVDDSLYEPQTVDFTPEVTQPALAKGIGGAMVGVALLVPLSLLWMALRVVRRGGYGRKASAVLRTVYPVVLGLGGWFAGLLIVVTTMPGIPLDDPLFAVLSVGLPIGSGIYLAWVRREWSARIKATGFAAAVGGSLVGGWLGLNAAEDLLALLTAILGATVGANLILLVLDIAWDRQARDRFAATNAKDTLEARPSTR